EASLLGEMVEAVEIAADTKTAIAGKSAILVVHRQARQLHRQAAAAVDRPVERDPAPGLARADRLHDAARGIEPKGFRDLGPWPAETDAVRAPISQVNSSEPSEKR